jgi:hypothetical protein
MHAAWAQQCSGYQTEHYAGSGQPPVTGATPSAVCSAWTTSTKQYLESIRNSSNGYYGYEATVTVVSCPTTAPANATWHIFARYKSSPTAENWSTHLDQNVTQSITAAQVACPTECEEKQGTTEPKNLTIGWSRYDADAYPEGSTSYETKAIATGAALVGQTICDGTCSISVGAPRKFWHAREPNAQGLYRLSTTNDVTYTGASCTGVDEHASDVAPSPPCEGYLGELNGKPTCVAPMGLPDPSISHPVPAVKGNPSAGGEGTAPLGSSGGGTGGTAGGPGRSGDGDVREGTEAPGDDGGSGGGGGSTPIEVEIETCGLPGKPPCKIDETGTPTPGDLNAAGTDARAEIDQAEQEGKGLIEGMAQRTDGKPQWTWSFALPSGCSPYPLEAFAFSIDICQWQPMIHDLMSLVWIAATIWACVAMVGATLNKG